MQNLTRASEELFARSPDERFETLEDLVRHCRQEKLASADRWLMPEALRPQPDGGGFGMRLGSEENFQLNDWSFTQLCRLAGLTKETVNRLSPATAALVLEETLPSGNKPLQVFTQAERVRSIHGASYTRLFNADLLDLVQKVAVDFQPPQKGLNGATGLYCGEQDLFAFLIDPTGWVEIGDAGAFAPGFFVFNSEVGRRSVGIQTFWFQSCCANHIVWDAVEVVDFTRKHTANVGEALVEVWRIIERLVAKRDARRDGFAQVIRQAAQQRLGDSAEEVLAVLARQGIGRGLAKQAVEIAAQQGRFTIFSLVDALTRLTQKVQWIGDRAEADAKAASLLALAV
jgi:histone H3/H4